MIEKAALSAVFLTSLPKYLLLTPLRVSRASWAYYVYENLFFRLLKHNTSNPVSSVIGTLSVLVSGEIVISVLL